MTSNQSQTVLRRWAGNLLALFMSLAAVVLLVAAAEGVLRLKVRLTTAPENTPVTGRLDGALNHTTILGVEGMPNGVLHCRAVRGERVLYDTTARTDSAGRRLTPCAATTDDADLALFFGCSITFGLGVEDGDTLPARYCAHAPDCCALNYGMPGYGPQQVWLQICTRHVLREFHARKGIIVYTFIDDHINRLVGTPEILTGWPYAAPWVELQDGHVVYRGTFYDRSPAQYLFLHYVQSMHLARFIENRLSRLPKPTRPSDKAVELMAQVVRECADTAAKEAPLFTFYCLILPKYFTPSWGKPLAERLTALNVNVLDYTDSFDNLPHAMDDLCFEDNTQYRWGHPKALGYDIIAQQMNKDLHPATPAHSSPAPSAAGRLGPPL